MPKSRMYLGAAGATQWLSGAGVPLGTLGVIGNFYLDTSTSTIYEKTSSGGWTNRGTLNTPPPPPFAYFVGGNSAPGGSIISNRGLDMNNDAAPMVIKGNLTAATGLLAACNSSLAGYFAGGTVGGTKIDKLVFASDTLAMTTVNNLTVTREALASVNSTTAGYFAGGNSGGVPVNSTDGMIFATDAVAPTAKGVLQQAKTLANGSANSTLRGYFTGGYDVALNPLLQTDCLIFATDGAAMINKGALGGVGGNTTGANSTTKGYFAGQRNGAVYSTICCALTFATDGVAMVNVGALNTAREFSSGANSTVKAYFGCGSIQLVPHLVTDAIDALIFATDITAMLQVSSLAIARDRLAACQSGGIL